MTKTPQARATRSKRRWLRYSLRGLMALVLLAAIFCGWVYQEVTTAREQRLAVEAILAYGGEVTFNGSTTISAVDDDARAELPAPTWWTRLLGEDPRLQVTHVRIDGRASQPDFDELIRLITEGNAHNRIFGTGDAESYAEFNKSLSMAIIGGRVVHEGGQLGPHDEDAAEPISVGVDSLASKPAQEPTPGDDILRLISKLPGLQLLEIRDETISTAAVEQLRKERPDIVIDDTDTRSFTGAGQGFF